MNHLGDTNKMVSEAVSDDQITAEATPAGELRRQILSPCVAKSEREWWASRTIEKLEFELNAANDRIKRLDEFVDQLTNPKFTRDDLPKEALLQRIKRLEEALGLVLKMQNDWLEMQDDGYAGAYYAFVKGNDSEWEEIIKAKEDKP